MEPQFGQIIVNTVVDFNSKYRNGTFVRSRGTKWEVTNGLGIFWELSPVNCVVMPEGYDPDGPGCQPKPDTSWMKEVPLSPDAGQMQEDECDTFMWDRMAKLSGFPVVTARQDVNTIDIMRENVHKLLDLLEESKKVGILSGMSKKLRDTTTKSSNRRRALRELNKSYDNLQLQLFRVMEVNDAKETVIQRQSEFIKNECPHWIHIHDDFPKEGATVVVETQSGGIVLADYSKGVFIVNGTFGIEVKVREWFKMPDRCVRTPAPKSHGEMNGTN